MAFSSVPHPIPMKFLFVSSDWWPSRQNALSKFLSSESRPFHWWPSLFLFQLYWGIIHIAHRLTLWCTDFLFVLVFFFSQVGSTCNVCLNSWPWEQESHALLTEWARCPKVYNVLIWWYKMMVISFFGSSLSFASHIKWITKILLVLLAFSYGEKTFWHWGTVMKSKGLDCGVEDTWLLILVLSLSTCVNLACMADG